MPTCGDTKCKEKKGGHRKDERQVTKEKRGDAEKMLVW